MAGAIRPSAICRRIGGREGRVASDLPQLPYKNGRRKNAPIAKFYAGTVDAPGVVESLTGEKSSPGMHYYCAGCDSEWVWYKNSAKPRLRMIDGGDAALDRMQQ